LTSSAASVTVHPFGKNAPEAALHGRNAGAGAPALHGFGKLAAHQQRTRVLEEDLLETKIFICYNALADPLASRELQEFCLTACVPGGPSTETGPTDRGQGSGGRVQGLNATARTPSVTPRGQSLPDSAAVEKIPCLGKVDPRYLLKAFEAGCDAVCLIGCAIGKCRTMDGNLRAQRRVILVRGLLEEIGLKGERLFLFLREPMTEQAARELVGQFIAEARALGPSELKAQNVDGLATRRTRKDFTAENAENAEMNR